jgi:glycosyltransferase involved in cell wall biosynthesis
MRVAVHAGQLHQPVPGGIGLYITALVARLPAFGVEPVAFAAGSRPRTMPAAVPWIDLGPPHGSVRYELWHRARRPVVRIDADVVHAPSLAIPPIRAQPLVVTVHDIAFMRFPNATTPRGASFHRRGLEIARREATLVLSPSTFTRDELIREGFAADDVLLAPLGVNSPLPRDPSEIDAVVARCGIREPFLLTVGTVEPRKDLPTIVAATQRLRTRRPELTLVIVGPHGWGDVRGIDGPGVHVVGELPWRTVDALIRRASACCIASRYEGFGLPALEALARGAPLVAANDSALTEVVGDAGLLFTPGDVDEMTAALERVLEDPALCADLARKGRLRAETMTWEASAQAHAAAFTVAGARYLQRA